MVEKIIFYVLTFFLYSAVGWFFESCYCSVRPRKWVNRGFLYGPMCPIYGSGAVMLSLALGKFSKLPIYRHGWYLTPVLTFLLGALLADVLEFLTSLVMEKLFHARWWDYSQKKFNIQGRICLTHTLYWGGATLIFLYFIDPRVSALLLGRCILGYTLTIPLGLGVPGIWIALVFEWLVRSIALRLRFRGEKWLHIGPASAD